MGWEAGCWDTPVPPHQIVRVEHGGGPAGVGIFQVVKAGVGSDF